MQIILEEDHKEDTKFLLEDMTMTLEDWLKDNPKKSQSRFTILSDIIEQIEELEKKSYVIKDFQQNILINSKETIQAKIANLGLCMNLTTKEIVSHAMGTHTFEISSFLSETKKNFEKFVLTLFDETDIKEKITIFLKDHYLFKEEPFQEKSNREKFFTDLKKEILKLNK